MSHKDHAIHLSTYSWSTVELIETDLHVLTSQALVAFKHRLKLAINHYISCIEYVDLLNMRQSSTFSIQQLQILLQLCVLATRPSLLSNSTSE